MVHINRVATSKEVESERITFDPVPSTSGIDLTPEDDADDFTATVYGSKYAAEDLPRHEMPVRRETRTHFHSQWSTQLTRAD